MSGTDIRNGFNAIIAAYAGSHSPKILVGYDNIDFAPPSSGVWLQVTTSFGNSHFIGMEAGSSVSDQGLSSVYVNTRKGSAASAMQNVADEIRDLFPMRKAFGGAYVDASPFQRGPLFSDSNDSVHITVVVPWITIR